MRKLARIKHFLKYYWLNSAILVGFSVASIAFPMAMTIAGKWQWEDWSIWFWIVTSINALNLAITTVQYVQYIRFGR